MAFKLNLGKKGSGEGRSGFSLKQTGRIMNSTTMAAHDKISQGDSSPFLETEEEKKRREMGEKTTTVTEEKVEGGRNIHTDTSQDYTDITEGRAYKDSDEAEKGRAYWAANPDKREEYEKNLRTPGNESNRSTKFIPDPKKPKPKTPKPKVPVDATLTKPSRKNASGVRGVNTQQTDFKKLTPKQQESIKKRNVNANKTNASRNAKTRPQLIKDKGWTGKTLTTKQKEWLTSTLAKKKKIFDANKSTLTIS